MWVQALVSHQGTRFRTRRWSLLVQEQVAKKEVALLVLEHQFQMQVEVQDPVLPFWLG